MTSLVRHGIPTAFRRPLAMGILSALLGLGSSPVRADSTAEVPAERQGRAEVGQPLPTWTRGELDVHHINTGRGDAIFFILPDGTTMLVDACDGQAEPLPPPFGLPTKPDSSRQSGEWVARYIAHALRDAPEKKIDYAVLTHFHGDHIGAVTPKSKRSPHGDYFLTGISEIPEFVPVHKIIDRNWPDYDYPAPLPLENYRKFLAWQIEHRRLVVEQFRPGDNDQLALRYAAADFPNFEIRNLMSNGRVWTGQGNDTRELADLSQGQRLNENQCSIAFRVSYGKFDYFSGGDLDARNAVLMGGAEPWRDVEPAVARVCGPVDALKANHHGSWDANSPEFLRLLRPRVIVVTSRADGHPAAATFQRMISRTLWEGPRDIFITNVTPATHATTYGLDQAKSHQGHVVIRVDAGGATYRVYVLDDSNEEQRVKAVFGPYPAT